MYEAEAIVTIRRGGEWEEDRGHGRYLPGADEEVAYVPGKEQLLRRYIVPRWGCHLQFTFTLPHAQSSPITAPIAVQPHRIKFLIRYL